MKQIILGILITAPLFGGEECQLQPTQETKI